MKNPYRTLFHAPGAAAFAGAGLLGRLALPMTGIGIITMLSQRSGSYTLAGGVAASFVLTYAVLSPQVSRLVDRFGQRRVLPLATMISLIGLALLVMASAWQAPLWLLFSGAVLSGAMPSISAMIRARWSALFRGRPGLQTAYSLETVLDEVTFIAGPPLSVGLSIMGFPEAGVLAAAAILAVGTLALVVQHRTEPPITDPGISRAASLIRRADIRLLTLLLVAMGIIVGTVDITSVAFAEHLGRPAMASAVLAAYAAGSCLAGLVFGGIVLEIPLHRLLLWGGLATAAATVPLMGVSGLPSLAAAVFVAGLFFAPTMIVAMSLVEKVAPDHQLTEGMTWLLAGLNIGVALGAALSGQMVDLHGPAAAFGVALCAGLTVVLFAVWGSLRLSALPARDGI